jgi:hypothetical protein
VATVAEQPTVADARNARDQAKAELDRLFTLQSELTAQIQECADQARLGKAVGDLNVLATEKAETDRALTDAEAALARAQQRFAEATAEADRQRFDAIVAEHRKCRKEFSATLRTACLQLGTLFRLRAEAGELSRSQTRTAGPSSSPIYYRDPFVDSALAEMDADLPKASDFITGHGPDVLIPDAHLGWRAEVKICPLNPKGEMKNERSRTVR